MISYDIFNKAFEDTKRNSKVSCFKRNSKTYQLDLPLMKDRLHDFLHSKNSSFHMKMIQNPLTDCYWGVDAFKHIPIPLMSVISIWYTNIQS